MNLRYAATTYEVFLFSEYKKDMKEIELDDVNLMLLTGVNMGGRKYCTCICHKTIKYFKNA